MGKKIAIIFLFFCLAITLINFGLSESSERAITGKATSGSASLTITVSALPSIGIISPINATYIRKGIALKYTAFSADNVWYNLDNGANHTLSGNSSFSVEDGSHTFNLYANNSQGFSSKSVVFKVNTTLLIIDYTRFQGVEKGNSTNFYDYSLEELNNLGGIVLENTSAGKISFDDNLNLSEGKNDTNVVNITKNVIIKFNNVYLNSTNIQIFNDSATLHLYGLNFSNPQILLNGEVCPSSVCTKISYSGGDLKFRVTHFTNYSTRETPSTPSSEGNTGGGSGGGGGGGGGGSTSTSNVSTKGTTEHDFKIDASNIQLMMNKGTYYQKELVVTNNGTQSIPISISISNVQGFVFPTLNSFTLEPGENKTVVFNIFVSSSKPSDVYFGKINFNSPYVRKEVNVILQVNEVPALFDVNSKVITKEISPGGILRGNVTIKNLGDLNNVQANLEYKVIDLDGKTYVSRSQSFEINRSKSIDLSLQIPRKIDTGNYLFYVKVNYEGKNAVSSSGFTIVENHLDKVTYYLIVGIIILFIIRILRNVLKFQALEEAKKKIHIGVRFQ